MREIEAVSEDQLQCQRLVAIRMTIPGLEEVSDVKQGHGFGSCLTERVVVEGPSISW